MTKRNVMIHMLVSRLELGMSLFDDGGEEETEEEDRSPFDLASCLGEMPEPDEMLMEGRLVTNEKRVELIYEESELTGMEGSTTEVGFDLDNAGLVTMMRHGSVSTVLVFEKGKRHICAYKTEYMPFEICVNTKDVQNTLLENGKIFLDYIIEIRGAQAERTLFTIEISEISPVNF